MAESKIEKQEPSSDFESLYEKAVKKINETNFPITILSAKFKKKFLNFYNLPANEQLELISDLSTIQGLPQEMADAIKQFPYFHTIPTDTLNEIGSYLKKKGPHKDKDISAFVATHKKPHTLFQPDRLGDLTYQLLLNVVTGKQDKAEKIVDMHPKLQLARGTVTDYSSRIFKDITAYEYAYWVKDTHMRWMLERHMSEATKAAMLKRCEDIEKNGLTYVQHGVEVKGSKHFDFAPLKTALKNYIDGYDNWYNTNNWTAMEAAWMQVGKAQRDVPVHVANEYCREDRSFDPKPTFKEDKLPRGTTFYNYRTDKKESWFPLVISDSDGLGVNMAVSRARGGNLHAVGGSRVWWRVCPTSLRVVDWVAIDQLDRVRTDDLTQSRENLLVNQPVGICCGAKIPTHI
ncbi:hypothetical protein TUM19329_17200 [Legionella antarctica]|uniref:SidC homolog n=1 Tax=Legionella antarctica TaxID=2708020 RepID=A0A6F8T4I5_9GAMM|nr:hypothetical protein [Legionella antarctica]BCA95359.1 hypothetical protein TUM19329_17200 [Legionella antarctica]